MGSIRLLLALSVVAAHCGAIFGFTLVGGQIAVQSFYIISGFYMSLILNEKYIGKNNSYRLFISNRLIRLYPIYWTVLIGSVLYCIGIRFFSESHSMPVFDSYASVKTNVLSFAYLIFTNLFIFGQDIVMFLGIHPESGNLYFTSNFLNSHPPLYSFLFIIQAWTLGLELTFYLIAPFVVRRGLKIIVPLIILSFLLRLVIYDYYHLQKDPWTYRFFPTEIMFFLFGYLSYRMHLYFLKKPVASYISKSILILSIVFTIFYQYLPSGKADWFPFSIKELLYFLMIVLSIPLLFDFLKKSSLDNKIGELSYPVYISHMLVAGILASFSKRYSIAFLEKGWVMAFIVIVAAYLLNIIIAAPIEKYRQSRLKR